MTQKNVDLEVSGIESKFMRIALTLVAVVLIFAGPTYGVYLLADVAKMEYFASVGVGVALFFAGLLLLVYLIRKKVIT
jgi:uncharacterized membrane protein HdeD (DUF308 family)